MVNSWVLVRVTVGVLGLLSSGVVMGMVVRVLVG